MENNSIERNVAELQNSGYLLVEDGNHGEYRPRRHEFSSTGVAFIRAADLNNGFVNFENASKINDTAYARIRKGIGTDGDILLSHKGTVGKIAFIPNGSPQFVCSPQTTFWRSLDDNIIDRKYLYAYMHSKHFTDQLASRQNETDMAAYVSLTAQRSLNILLPKIGIQRAIAEILSSFGDKIAQNMEANKVLESMARAIFKAWFVDFEPVKAKAAGATSFPGIPQDDFDRLPDQFIEIELGAVPEGWDIVKLSDLVTLLGGGTPKRKVAEYWGGNIPWFSVRDAPSNHQVWVIDTEEKITQIGVDNSSAKVMREGTTIISARGTVGRLALTAVPMTINQSCYGLQGTDGVGDFFVYYTLINTVSELQHHTHGSVFDTITRKTFDTIHCVRPQRDMLDLFERSASSILNLIRNNLYESQTLSQIRDALLPKLISGELRVPDHLEAANGG